MDNELRKKLEALGVYFGTKEFINFNSHTITPFNSLPLQKSSNSLGEFYYSIKNFSNDYQHGCISFNDFLINNSLLSFNEFDEIFNIYKCIFLDTETTGLALTGGTFAFMVGIGWYENDYFTVKQYFLENPSQEDAMLLDLDNLICNFETIVTYNGISFDLPILKSRFRYHRLPNQLSQKKHLDLLKYARMYFKYQFESRSLRSMEVNVLHFQRSEEEIPGYLAPILYQEYLKNKDTDYIMGVFYHNEIDVVSLAALLNVVNEIANNKGHHFSNYETLHLSIARQFEKRGEYAEAIEHYLEALSHTKLSDTFRVNSLLSLAFLYKKLDQTDKSIEYFTQASAYGEIKSLIELAKIYEHKQRNYGLAIDCCKMALLILDNDVDSIKNSLLLQQIEFRLARLNIKAKNEKI